MLGVISVKHFGCYFVEVEEGQAARVHQALSSCRADGRSAPQSRMGSRSAAVLQELLASSLALWNLNHDIWIVVLDLLKMQSSDKVTEFLWVRSYQEQLLHELWSSPCIKGQKLVLEHFSIDYYSFRP